MELDHAGEAVITQFLKDAKYYDWLYFQRGKSLILYYVPIESQILKTWQINRRAVLVLIYTVTGGPGCDYL